MEQVGEKRAGRAMFLFVILYCFYYVDLRNTSFQGHDGEVM